MTDRITIPKPTVPYGPEDVPPDIATADAMRHVVQMLDGGYANIGGSNVTATVRKLLLDVADALARPAAVTAAARGDRPAERAALQTLAQIDLARADR